jgi:hypothetical protein
MLHDCSLAHVWAFGRMSPKFVAPLPAATRLYNISDQKSGLARPSIHRAFAGDPKKPSFTTVLSVLDAIGFRLHVTVRRGAAAARLKSAENCQPASGSLGT